MMGSKRRGRGVSKGGLEYEVVTEWRHVFCCPVRPGVTASMKNRMWRRERHDVKQKLREGKYE